MRRWPRGPGWLPIAPLTLPSFELMIEDIGASPAELARHLGVDLWTVRSWLRGEPHARRPVLLALFYETKWGRSFVSVRSENDARHYGQVMVWLEAEVIRLRELLRSAGNLADFGAANDPSPDIELPAATQADVRRTLARLPPSFAYEAPLMPSGGRQTG